MWLLRQVLDDTRVGKLDGFGSGSVVNAGVSRLRQ